MGGKAKPAHHTAKELQNKADLHKPRGGGKDGKAERAIKINYTCVICKLPIASLDSLKTHYDAKHPKETFSEATYADQINAAKQAAQDKPRTGKKYEFTGKKGPSTL